MRRTKYKIERARNGKIKRQPPLTAPKPRARKPLTYLEQRVLDEYLKDFDKTAAGLRAGIKPENAMRQAWAILNKPHVVDALRDALEERYRKADVKIDDLIRYWYSMATADAREFNPLRWRCCRYCWGVGHRYQFTPNEYRRRKEKEPELGEEGGLDFNQMRDPMRGPEWAELGFEPNSDHSCPECNGKGVPRIEPIDLSKLSYGAQLIFDGVKVTKDGDIEFRLNQNRSKGMEQVALLLGFVRPRRPLFTVSLGDLSEEQIDAMLEEARGQGLIRLEDLRGVDNGVNGLRDGGNGLRDGGLVKEAEVIEVVEGVRE